MSNFYSEHNTAFRAPISDVVGRFGLRLKRQGPELVGPCPRCGGRDRFAINVRKEVWNCRGCIRGGNAIALVQHIEGCGYREALGVLGGADISARGRRAPTLGAVNDDRTLSVAVRIWDQSVALGPKAIAYFERRGVPVDDVPDHGGLRWHPTCPWDTTAVDNKPREIWRRPIDGTKTKALAPTAGCVNRLWPDAAVETALVLGEGVETTLAASTRIEHRGTLLQPAWAAGSAGNMANFPVLSGIEALTILVDNDSAGERAADQCRARWGAAGREVTLLKPNIAKTDFNNVVL